MKPPKKDGDGGEDAARPQQAGAAHTLLGIPGSRGAEGGAAPGAADADEGGGGSTMFGVGPRGGGGRPAAGPLGGRRPTGKGVRQTLMGLGSVRVLNEPEDESGEGRPPASTNVRATMTGMPGVTARRPEGGETATADAPPKLRADAAARHTMMGMPAVKDRSGAGGAPVLSAGNYVLRPGSAEEEATVAVSAEEVRRARELVLNAGAGLAQPPSLAQAPSLARPPSPQRVATAVAPAAKAPAAGAPVSIPAFDDDEPEEYDPLAGFEGAAQGKISSLMDEEVENLSAQVFGNEFAFGDEDLDLEDDEEEDFDFAGGASASRGSAALGHGDVPEDEVEHDFAAAAAALGDMMADLEDVMPTEDEAAASLGLDESRMSGSSDDDDDDRAHEEDVEDDDASGPVEVDEDATIADADVSQLMAKLSTRDEKVISTESATIRSSGETRAVSASASEPAPRHERLEATVEDGATQITDTPLAQSSGGGFGLPGVLGVLGGLAALAWMVIPIDGVMTLSAFGSLDTSSKVLVIFSALGGLLAIVGSVMKLPSTSKGLILAVLGAGLGVLAATAPVLKSPASSAAYAAAGLLVLGGLLFFAMKPKKS